MYLTAHRPDSPIELPPEVRSPENHASLSPSREVDAAYQQLYRTITDLRSMVGRYREAAEALEQAHHTSLVRLAQAVELKEDEHGTHLIRVAQLSARLGHYAGLDPRECELLCRAAPLHDIGKIGVPDRVLLKPGRLSEDEYEEIKQHTRYGREAIERAEQFYGGAVRQSFLQFGKEMAYSHHEHWDGGGYPEGLRGEAIPLSGRIMAIADVYDALICRRRYKPSFTHEEAVALIEQGGGSHFDPLLTEVFLERQEVFRRIAREFPDRDDTDQPERTTTG